MRDAGLEAAIRAAGGVVALAHKLGISQPSVSNWSRVPAERVTAVEAVTGVVRAVLRPDLYAEPAGKPVDDAAHASERALLVLLLGRAPGPVALPGAGSQMALGLLHAALAEAAASMPA
jgi:DNA-binding transcriptional regulator YdaS (Cro superfamily)